MLIQYYFIHSTVTSMQIDSLLDITQKLLIMKTLKNSTSANAARQFLNAGGNLHKSWDSRRRI